MPRRLNSSVMAVLFAAAAAVDDIVIADFEKDNYDRYEVKYLGVHFLAVVANEIGVEDASRRRFAGRS
ncbi:hypothetical protein [Lacipirellula limnantheis]|uniref:Uncharacterized protein n=1 Tax=Lacipirellula limnantheis TaxID=2528024 RepID=A0A517TYQ5_9BACT|nr:hypothetical protein [Lacipirellula limnantheis]QDT73510.1 hypothetical protein I41_26990 [Lacipirellula limnantheis]